MTIILWGLVLAAAVWAAHWGSEQIAEPLKKLRRQWGFTEVAGAALVGLAAASPETAISAASALRGASDVGLGTMLGSNVLAIPLVVATAYWISRSPQRGGKGGSKSGGESAPDHERHRRERLLHVKPEAVTVQALPYLALVILVALLTLPPAWRGLQPLDGWLVLGAYVAYLAQALLRGRRKSERVKWKRRELALALGGVAALVVGAYFTVRATENIVAALGISKLVGGLFITTPMAVLPELFAVKSVVKSGQITAATTSVLGDHAVTITLAFFPLALATTPVKEVALYATNLLFVALMPALYAGLIWWSARERKEHSGFTLPQVAVFGGTYALYLAVMIFGVL